MYCVMLTRFERAEGLSCSVTCLYIAVLAVSRFFYSIYSPSSAGCAELPPTLLIARSVHVISRTGSPRLNFPRVQRSLNNYVCARGSAWGRG